jgi:H+/Cl- antiporter ClcA
MNKLSYQDVKDIAKGRADRSKKINGMNWMACVCIVMMVILLGGFIALSIYANNEAESVVYNADNGSQITVKDGYATLDGTSYILDKGDKDNNTANYGALIGWMILIPLMVILIICVYWYEVVRPKYKDAIIQYYLDKGELPDSDFNEKQ